MSLLYTQQEFDEVVGIARNNIEQFRHIARQAYRAYTKSERRQTRKLHPASEFYTMYFHQFRPVATELESKKRRGSLARQLHISLEMTPQDADTFAALLYSDRIEGLISVVTAALPRQARASASVVLQRPLADIDDAAERYKNAQLYRHVARELNIAVTDPHASLLRRYIATWRTRHDQKRTRARTAARIAAIDAELAAIDTPDNSLLRGIVDNTIELIQVLALRNEFEKTKRGRTRAHQPASELQQFERITKDFIKEALDAYTLENTTISFSQLASKKYELQQLLQTIFALENSTRNRLVVTISTYQKLTQEKQQILSEQAARDTYIASE